MEQVQTARAGLRQWVGWALLALPTGLLGLDVTVLYLVLPAMAADLAPSATQMLWIMDAYGFLLAGFLVTMGTLGDRVGRRRLLMIGIAAFAAVSVFAAFVPTAELLIAARALLGVAGATLMPSTLALISNMFPDPRQRAVAIGVWATMFAGGMAAGPILGGVLVETFWWGAAFLVAVPIAVVVLLLGPAVLPEYRDRVRRAGRSGQRGTVFGGGPADRLRRQAGRGPRVERQRHRRCRHGNARGVGILASAAPLDNPLLDVALFRNTAFSVALTVLLVGLVGVGGSMYLVTQYLQLVEGLSPFVAGLWMGPPALAMFIAAIGAPCWRRHIRPGYVMGGTLGVSLRRLRAAGHRWGPGRRTAGCGRVRLRLPRPRCDRSLGNRHRGRNGPGLEVRIGGLPVRDRARTRHRDRRGTPWQSHHRRLPIPTDHSRWPRP